MYLVFASPTDAPALWAWQGLLARGLPADLVTADALVAAPYWEHRVGNGGRTALRITLPDGRFVDASAVRGALNRLTAVPAGFLAASADRSYANQELYAFFLSWLRALPGPLLNPPSPQGLCGRWRPSSEWVWLAARAGLPTAPFQQSSEDAPPSLYGEKPLFPPGAPGRTVLVTAGRTSGAPAPRNVLAGCLRLAAEARAPLLGVDFVAGPAGSWTFAGATPWPDLRLGGELLLDQLAAALQESS
jgi:hypothetical protein